MPAAYSLNGNKIHRNGKHIATLKGEDIEWNRGQQQFKTEVLDFISNLDEDLPEEPAAKEEPAPAPKPEPKPEPEPIPEPVPEAPTPPAPVPKEETPAEEPPQSLRFGDLTPEVVAWRKTNWPADKFKATYHRRLNTPELEQFSD